MFESLQERLGFPVYFNGLTGRGALVRRRMLTPPCARVRRAPLIEENPTLALGSGPLLRSTEGAGRPSAPR